MSSIALLASTLSTFITIYTGLLFVRILLTWFPNISFYDQPFATLAQLTDPYLNLFRSIIPPLGGMDLSPMLAIIILQLLGGFVKAGIPALV
jgi:YggT family protein